MLDRNPFMAGNAAHVSDDHLVPFTQSGLDFNEFRCNHAEAHGYARRALARIHTENRRFNVFRIEGDSFPIQGVSILPYSIRASAH